MPLDYAFYDGHPLRVSDSEAWLYKDGEWSRIDLVLVVLDAALMSKEKFDETFGPLPDLPPEALS